MAQQPPSGSEPPHYRGFTITLRHTTLHSTPLDEWSAWRTDLYLTTLIRDRHSCPDGIQTRNIFKRAAALPRLRPRGHRDRLLTLLFAVKRQKASCINRSSNCELYLCHLCPRPLPSLKSLLTSSNGIVRLAHCCSINGFSDAILV
jgi:hypothetical protein